MTFLEIHPFSKQQSILDSQEGITGLAVVIENELIRLLMKTGKFFDGFYLHFILALLLILVHSDVVINIFSRKLPTLDIVIVFIYFPIMVNKEKDVKFNMFACG